ncbi:hypothetical protein QBC42DRAFT_289871 [Cladorrhinum samala]|uniref:Uncharacterized protein n=1 Tax=Cladorrhinum samala TaxID=585594 RepID=A0AAV9HHL3_9PEZI|nr:hypothetical protein QBC42DRAFT_289871 [Cladorrhinum samala]
MTLSRKAAVWPHTDPFHAAATSPELSQSVMEHREQLRKLDRFFVAETVRGYEQECGDVETQTENAQNNRHINPKHRKRRLWPLSDAAKRCNGVLNVQQQALKEETTRHNHPKAEKKHRSELFKTFIGWNKKLKQVFLSSKSDPTHETLTSLEDEEFPENRENPGMATNPSTLLSSLEYSPKQTMPSPKADVEFVRGRTRDLQDVYSAAGPATAAAVTHESSQPRPNPTPRWNFAPDLGQSMDRELKRRRGAVDFTALGTFPIPPVYPSTPPPLYIDY